MAEYLDTESIEFVKDHGWRYDDATCRFVITEDQFRRYRYALESLRYPGVRMIVVPTDHGSRLYYEGKHFVITPE